MRTISPARPTWGGDDATYSDRCGRTGRARTIDPSVVAGCCSASRRMPTRQMDAAVRTISGNAGNY
ncbi:hypothetical protein [Nocardia sp. NPDC058497]|uniref:hypothetical protein n=1 Tax=Nocardia sp. NPDC058497 TaxID=3346529 RepID=UPI003651850D